MSDPVSNWYSDARQVLQDGLEFNAISLDTKHAVCNISHNHFLQEHHALAAVHAGGQATGSTLYLRARLGFDVLLLPFPFISFVAMTVVRYFSSAGHTARENVTLKKYHLLDDSHLT